MTGQKTATIDFSLLQSEIVYQALRDSIDAAIDAETESALRIAAFHAGQFVALGYITGPQAFAVLNATAQETGLTGEDIRVLVISGLTAGCAQGWNAS